MYHHEAVQGDQFLHAIHEMLIEKPIPLLSIVGTVLAMLDSHCCFLGPIRCSSNQAAWSRRWNEQRFVTKFVTPGRLTSISLTPSQAASKAKPNMQFTSESIIDLNPLL